MTTTTEENVPADATAMKAEAIVFAALSWRRSADVLMTDKFTREEWALVEACEAYGDRYKGVRGA